MFNCDVCIIVVIINQKNIACCIKFHAGGNSLTYLLRIICVMWWTAASANQIKQKTGYWMSRTCLPIEITNKGFKYQL